jgi:uncharacterized membrane protein YhdT
VFCVNAATKPIIPGVKEASAAHSSKCVFRSAGVVCAAVADGLHVSAHVAWISLCCITAPMLFLTKSSATFQLIVGRLQMALPNIRPHFIVNGGYSMECNQFTFVYHSINTLKFAFCEVSFNRPMYIEENYISTRGFISPTSYVLLDCSSLFLKPMRDQYFLDSIISRIVVLWRVVQKA